MRNIDEITDRERIKLIRLRLTNEKFESNNVKITKVKIIERYSSRFAALVYSNRFASERQGFVFTSKMFPNEFLLLQKMGFDLNTL